MRIGAPGARTEVDGVNGLGAACCVAFGGAIGALLRFGVNAAFLARGVATFPWSTFLINVSGSLAIGIVAGIAEARGMNAYLRVFLTVGILGGYTTFSSFAYEVLALGRDGAQLGAAAYAIGSVVLGIAAAFAGVAIGRAA